VYFGVVTGDPEKTLKVPGIAPIVALRRITDSIGEQTINVVAESETKSEEY